jgi:hypothetical protein
MRADEKVGWKRCERRGEVYRRAVRNRPVAVGSFTTFFASINLCNGSLQKNVAKNLAEKRY